MTQIETDPAVDHGSSFLAAEWAGPAALACHELDRRGPRDMTLRRRDAGVVGDLPPTPRR
jgi:hypothetical protein